AQVTSATFRRIANTELAPGNELVTQRGKRRRNYWAGRGEFLPIGGAATSGDNEIAPELGGGLEVRSRQGHQAIEATKAVANLKYSTQVGIFDTDVELTFTFSAKGRRFLPWIRKRPESVPVRVAAEVSIPTSDGTLLKDST
nr:hypothetical protein [Micromonospora sp. DSM 115978]